MRDYITKKKFNALSIREQVELFNRLIREDKLSITNCCKKVGIAYSTIRDRFKKNHYVFNKFKRQYENVADIFPYDEEKLINRVVEEINRNNQVRGDLRLDPKPRQDIINRSFGVDKETLDRFIHFCDNSTYKQYDILSKFIEEGLSRYEENVI